MEMRKEIIKRGVSALVLASVLVPTGAARNIILMIGDGMGPEQVKAASYYAEGRPGAMSLEAMPGLAWAHTDSATKSPTDSAASATAMATGRKVDNGVISQLRPGDHSDIKTILEVAKEKSYRVGLVTSTEIAHATPAGFGAHADNRGNYAEICKDYMKETRPNVLFGGGVNELMPAIAEENGYTVADTREELIGLQPGAASHYAGLFGKGHLPYVYDGPSTYPQLHEMTHKAIELLERRGDGEKGFFLMVEGGRIDHAGHANQLERNVMETIEFSRAVQVAMDWANNQDEETLLIVTADHETGGMHILANRGKGKFPHVTWTTDYHTDVRVPVYSMGPGSEDLNGEIDNTLLYNVMLEFLSEVN